MDMKCKELMDYLVAAFLHPDVSGFEILEIMDVRSKLAAREPVLSIYERARLEELDRHLVSLAGVWANRVAEVADLADMRNRAHVLPSHWWWYIDEMIFTKQKVQAGS